MWDRAALERERGRLCSRQEDLGDQLKQQEVVHCQLLQQTLEAREHLDEYRELLLQLQRRGRFLSSGWLDQSEESCTERRPIRAEEERLARENRLLRLEIEALRSQVLEVDEDQAIISERLRRRDSICLQTEAEQEPKEDMVDKQKKEEDILMHTTDSHSKRGRLHRLQGQLKLLERDVRNAGLERSQAFDWLEVERKKAKLANHKLLDFLGDRRSSSSASAYDETDLEQTMLESAALWLQLDKVQRARQRRASPTTPTPAALSPSSLRSKPPACRSTASKVFGGDEEAEKILLTLKNSKKQKGPQCLEYLQKMALTLLEIMELKDQRIGNEASMKRTLGLYVSRLEARLSLQYGDHWMAQAPSQESTAWPKSTPDSTVSFSAASGDGVSIGFEIPMATTDEELAQFKLTSTSIM